jgi:Mrp family chromosome partitioning ATPase
VQSTSPTADGDVPGRGGLPLLHQLRRHWALVVVTAVVAAAAAYALSASREESFASTALVLVQNGAGQGSIFGSPGPSDSATQGRSTATIAALAETRQVASLVARSFDDLSPQDVETQVVTTADETTNLIRITATATDPQRAASLANVTSREFRELQAARQRAQTREDRRALQRRYKELTALQRDGEAGDTLREEINRLRAVEAVGATQLVAVQDAVPPTQGDANVRQSTLLGGLFGLLLGCGIALLREQVDRRVRREDDLERILGVPVLAEIPDAKELGRGVPVGELRPGHAEGFRLLWTHLRFTRWERPMRRVLVTSPGPREGKSTVCWYLASAAALLGARVLLVEGDARRPVLAERHRLPPHPGLLGLLRDRLALADAVARVPVGGAHAAGMDVLAAGGATNELVSVESMGRILHLLREEVDEYDLVVVDAPPVTLAADAVPLSTAVDGVLIVSRPGRTTRDGLVHVRAELERLRAQVVGIVLDGGSAPSYYEAPRNDEASAPASASPGARAAREDELEPVPARRR